jgi:hypothetical protein
MPEVLFKRACTPQMVAAAQSEERENQFLMAVQEGGAIRGHCVDTGDDDSGDELEFVEASETL